MINEFVEKLIEKFKDGAFMIKTSGLSFINLDRAIRIANELAEEYKNVPDTNNNDWVPCSEKCPPNDTYCLITDYKGDIRIEKHLSGNEWYAGFNYVIAWKPLPKPYKGEKLH